MADFVIFVRIDECEHFLECAFAIKCGISFFAADGLIAIEVGSLELRLGYLWVELLPFLPSDFCVAVGVDACEHLLFHMIFKLGGCARAVVVCIEAVERVRGGASGEDCHKSAGGQASEGSMERDHGGWGVCFTGFDSKKDDSFMGTKRVLRPEGNGGFHPIGYPTIDWRMIKR